MKIKTLQLVVPNKACINNCKFCMSRARKDDYPNFIESKNHRHHYYQTEYLNRLSFARDNGCNVLVLTGTAEPQQNKKFLCLLGDMNQLLPNPFKWIEMQTTGVQIDTNYLIFLRQVVGVSTISLSISSLHPESNRTYNGIKDTEFCFTDFCKEVKDQGFNLRLSINLTDAFENLSLEEIFETCKYLGADQITFKELYYNPMRKTDQDKWCAEHKASDILMYDLRNFLHLQKKLETLPYGNRKYSINGMGVAVDFDCMNNKQDEIRYLILRPNCKLYSKWDDPASLIF